ncbi:hypothetical protein CWC24_17930 [Pseudoalteromonas ruthenica]|nr:hypothetical protein CWC24_17930 [Pseudoalteromonas ruthenica]TMO48447.1 hypothetical protein CWC23_17555 [Pseudoalteromonas ruthenica]
MLIPQAQRCASLLNFWFSKLLGLIRIEHLATHPYPLWNTRALLQNLLFQRLTFLNLYTLPTCLAKVILLNQPQGLLSLNAKHRNT